MSGDERTRGEDGSLSRGDRAIALFACLVIGPALLGVGCYAFFYGEDWTWKYVGGIWLGLAGLLAIIGGPLALLGTEEAEPQARPADGEVHAGVREAPAAGTHAARTGFSRASGSGPQSTARPAGAPEDARQCARCARPIRRWPVVEEALADLGVQCGPGPMRFEASGRVAMGLDEIYWFMKERSVGQPDEYRRILASSCQACLSCGAICCSECAGRMPAESRGQVDLSARKCPVCGGRLSVAFVEEWPEA